MAVSSHPHACGCFISEGRATAPTKQEAVWAPTIEDKPLNYCTANTKRGRERPDTQLLHNYETWQSESRPKIVVRIYK